MMYLRLGALIAFMAVAGLALWFRAEAATARSEAAEARANLAVAEDANREAVRTIDALQEQARQDSRLTASFIEEMRKVNAGLAAQADALTELGKLNAVVRTFLDAAVPADIRKLYHH